MTTVRATIMTIEGAPAAALTMPCELPLDVLCSTLPHSFAQPDDIVWSSLVPDTNGIAHAFPYGMIKGQQWYFSAAGVAHRGPAKFIGHEALVFTGSDLFVFEAEHARSARTPQSMIRFELQAQDQNAYRQSQTTIDEAFDYFTSRYCAALLRSLTPTH